MPRADSRASQSSQQPRTFKRMFQETLRVTGLKQRPKDGSATHEQRAVTSDNKASTSSKGFRKQLESKVTFAKRSSKQAGRASLGNAPDEQPIKPFVAPSLRQASLSSPALNLFSNPSGNARPSMDSVNSPATPNRPLRVSVADSPRPSLSISRPRSLLPTSPSTPTLNYFPETPTRRIVRKDQQTHSPVRGTTPSPVPRQTRSPPPTRLTRLPLGSSSTSHLPASGRSPTAVSFAQKRDANRSTSPIPRGLSPNFASRNTSSISINGSSPHREVIRTASSILVKQLARPPPHIKLRDWEDVEMRLSALARLERIWGKSGGGSSSTAVGSTAGFGSGEDRERRLFCEAVRDGYVLCAYVVFANRNLG